MTVTNSALPTAPPPRRRRYRWVLYTFLGLVGFVLVGGVLAIVGLQWMVKSFVRDYSEAQAQVLPQVDNPAQKVDVFTQNVIDFKRALDTQHTTGPLVLTDDDLNALIQKNDQIKNWLCCVIQSNQLAIRFSLPVGVLLKGQYPGRFLNGVAHLHVSLDESLLNIRVVSIEARGKSLPKLLVNFIRKQNLAKQANANPDFSQILPALDKIEIQDEKINIHPFVPKQ